MSAMLAVGTIVIALTGLIAWALWHLINDRKAYLPPSDTQHELHPADLHPEPEELPEKETPATSQLNIPPTYFPTQSSMPGGSGGGSWSFQRRGMKHRRKRWPRMDQ